MRKKIEEAFGRIRADQGLKDRTKAFLAERTRGYAVRPRAAPSPLGLAAAACLVLMLAGGGWLWLVPAAEISIDVNPSVELSVNRLDRVISVQGRNDDGRRLAASLDLRFADYAAAVETVLESPQLVPLLERGETVAITVVGPDEGRCARMLSRVESSTAGRRNTYCCSARPQEVSDAHEAGLSCGKYKAFLELRALDPSVTLEEVRSMTMGELLRRIRALSPEGDGGPWGGNGQGQGYGRHHQDHHG